MSKAIQLDETFYKKELNAVDNDSHLYTLDECKKYINELRRTYGVSRKIYLMDGRGSDYARASNEKLGKGKFSIALPKWARNPYQIIHEFCHIYTADMNEGWGHGKEFQKNLLYIVRRELDSNTYKRLKKELK